MMALTLEQLQALCPNAWSSRLEAVCAPLNDALAEFEIDTPARQSAFLAQVAHESGCFRYLRELASGEAYEGNLHLGNTEPGDGPRFRGWGWMQTTGRKNTALTSQALYGDHRLVEDPKLIDPPSLELCARAAGWFWTVGAGLNLSARAKHYGVPEYVNLNDLADRGDFEGITLAINGGLNGYEDRLAQLHRAQTLIT